MARTPMWAELHEQSQLTYFAAHDDAFDNIPRSVLEDLQSTSTITLGRVNDMFHNHAVAWQSLTFEEGTYEDEVYSAMTPGGKLFVRIVDGVGTNVTIPYPCFCR